MSRPNKTRSAAVDIGPSGPILDLGSHVATKVAVLANRLSRAASRYYRKRYGIGVVEWRLVMFIGQMAETRANLICSRTELDKGAVSRSLAVLQRLGLVSIKADGADSRCHNVALTAKGRALHDEMVPIALERQSELLAGLSQAEIQAFVRLIDCLLAKVDDGGPAADEPALPLPLPSRHASSPRPRPRRPSGLGNMQRPPRRRRRQTGKA